MRVLALCAVLSSGCLSLHALGAGMEEVRTMVRKMDCRDGAPARVLVDAHCVDGVCGITCAPDRWKDQNE